MRSWTRPLLESDKQIRVPHLVQKAGVRLWLPVFGYTAVRLVCLSVVQREKDEYCRRLALFGAPLIGSFWVPTRGRAFSETLSGSSSTDPVRIGPCEQPAKHAFDLLPTQSSKTADSSFRQSLSCESHVLPRTLGPVSSCFGVQHFDCKVSIILGSSRNIPRYSVLKGSDAASVCALLSCSCWPMYYDLLQVWCDPYSMGPGKNFRIPFLLAYSDLTFFATLLRA